MVLADLDQLDKRIEEQRARLDGREEPEKENIQYVEHEKLWTKKMEEAFKNNIGGSEKCRACNWMNTGQKIVILNHIGVMHENLPIITYICRNCGSLFVPKWVRKVMLQAIEAENRVLKARADGEAHKEV